MWRALIHRKPLLEYLSFRLDETEPEALLPTRRRLLLVTFLPLFLVGAIPVLEPILRLDNVFWIDAAKHSNLEIFCGLISLIISFIVFLEYSASGKPTAFFLVLSFLSMGVLDVFHALSDLHHNMFVWFHSFSAFFGGFFLFLAAFPHGHPWGETTSLWARRGQCVLAVVAVLCFAYGSIRLNTSIPSVLSFELPSGTPANDARGTFSAFIYALNLFSGLLFLGAGILFVKGFSSTDDIVFLIFASSAFLFSESEILFAFSKLWNPVWWYWHIIKVIIFSGLLIGLAYGFTQTVRKLHASKAELAKLVKKIEEKSRLAGAALERLKETQRYLKESEKLASIGKAAASLAHEIRNPLGAISNSIGIFRRHGMADGEDRELLGIIDNEIDRLNTLVEDFICYARPDRIRREPVDINDVMDETLDVLFLNPRVGSSVTVDRHYAPELPELRIDRNRIKQVFLNVLNNALQALPNDGTITVRVRHKADDAEVEISITDTGEGIPVDVLPKVFQPFFSTKDKGMGLGLNIVHKIMKAHGGYMLLSSSPGRGTEVQLCFPVGDGTLSPVDGKSSETLAAPAGE